MRTEIFTTRAHPQEEIPEQWRELSQVDFSKGKAFSLFKECTYNDKDFCMVEEESASGGVYVNLLKNPERFTGYAGHQAARIWAAIYDENCFTAQHTSPLLLDGFECKEKRVFYKIISGAFVCLL